MPNIYLHNARHKLEHACAVEPAILHVYYADSPMRVRMCVCVCVCGYAAPEGPEQAKSPLSGADQRIKQRLAPAVHALQAKYASHKYIHWSEFKDLMAKHKLQVSKRHRESLCSLSAFRLFCSTRRVDTHTHTHTHTHT